MAFRWKLEFAFATYCQGPFIAAIFFFVFGLLSCLFLQVSSVRPTWFEDIAAPKDTTSQSNQDPQWQQSQPLHGLKLVIKEEVLPMKDQPEFPS